MKRPRLNIAGFQLLAAALAVMAISGCGLNSQSIRLPTRPDGVTDQDVLAGAGDFGTGSEPACVDLGPPLDGNRLRMLDLVNRYREQRGLNRLQYSRTLAGAGDDFAMRMYREDFFDHDAPDGSTPGSRALAAGFCDEYVGENIAYGLNSMDSADAAMEGFMNSPDHNTNMLRSRWDYLGVGYLRIEGAQGAEYWWVQMFGTDDNAH